MKSLAPNLADLFRALCMPRNGASEKAFAQAIDRVADWDAVLERARQHRILPLLHLKLEQYETNVPADVFAQTRTEFERNALHCMTNAEELLRVLNEFEEARIEAMPFKGVVLASAAYHDVTARTAGDLDLLIRYRDLQRATSILESRGYELKTKTLEDGSPEAANYFEFHFERSSDGMVLELRWRLELTQPRFRHNLGLDWVWADRRSVLLTGAAVPNLDPVRSLLMLCMHGSKHAWSRWSWICDVGKFIESEPSLDWSFAQTEAKRVGLERCLVLGVLLAARGAGAVVPARVLRQFAADRSMGRLADCLLSSLLELPQAVARRRVPYHLQILGSRDRVRALLSPSILQPNERDRDMVKLPRWLSPLYYVVRPIRILIDRSTL